MTTNTTIRPFRIDIAQAQIVDLQRRLAATRWPQPVDPGFGHGQSLALVRELAAYWADGFDWRAQEARLNRHPQFITEIDGQTVHFIHVKSKEPNAFPLILTHGWPSSPAEYLDLIGPLTDPRSHGLDASIAFDLVIPSVPGMGLSSPLAATGWDAARTAAAWHTLMTRLGYTRYGAQGGDVGAVIGREQHQTQCDLHHNDNLRNPKQVPEPHRRVMARPRHRTPHSGEQVRRQNGDSGNQMNVFQIASFSTM
jgi:pimeloyl-ACP methyl ester carboxylesterase